MFSVWFCQQYLCSKSLPGPEFFEKSEKLDLSHVLRLWYFSCFNVQASSGARCLVGPFNYFHTSCVLRAKALARLWGCAGSPEPSLVAYVISTIISWAGSFNENSDNSILKSDTCTTNTFWKLHKFWKTNWKIRFYSNQTKIWFKWLDVNLTKSTYPLEAELLLFLCKQYIRQTK